MLAEEAIKKAIEDVQIKNNKTATVAWYSFTLFDEKLFERVFIFKAKIWLLIYLLNQYINIVFSLIGH